MTHLSPEWRQKLLDAGFPAEELNLGVAEEILRRLPHSIDLTEKNATEMDRRTLQLPINLHLSILPDGADWKIEYSSAYAERAEWEHGESLANATASMWVFLKENNLLPNELD